MKILNAVKELLGIVLLRFCLVPRIWAALLIVVNAGAVFFLDTQYGQVVLATALLGALAMVMIYLRLGFVRLLGIGHILWIPMLIWIGTDLSKLEPDALLRSWLSLLQAVNTVSLVIDGVDVVRYLRGERKPHYSWE